jgi:hypothetical protein
MARQGSAGGDGGNDAGVIGDAQGRQHILPPQVGEQRPWPGWAPWEGLASSSWMAAFMRVSTSGLSAMIAPSSGEARSSASALAAGELSLK